MPWQKFFPKSHRASEAQVIIFSAMFPQMTHPPNNEWGIQAMNKNTCWRDAGVYASFNRIYFKRHEDRKLLLPLSYKHIGFKGRDALSVNWISF